MSLPLRLSTSIKEFLDSEAAGGIVLMVSAALALIIANSPLAAKSISTPFTPILAASQCCIGSMTR